MRFYSSIVEADVNEIIKDLKDDLSAFNGSTVLVTGASGFLMSYIVDVLLAWNEVSGARSCRVIALDNHKTGVPDRLSGYQGDKNLRFVKQDISKPFEIDEPLHWIVHGASIASPTVYRQYPLETIDANVGGTRYLLDVARHHDVRGMIVMSTSEIYGDPLPEFIPTPEDYRGNVSCTGPRACYDESKRMAETLAMTYHRLHNTPVKIIRPFNVYGPGLRLNDQRVLPDFMTQVFTDQPIELLSDGTPTRSFCYVSDAINLMIRVLASKMVGEPINVGNDEAEMSMKDLAHLVARVGAKVLDRPTIEVRLRISEDKDYLVDNPQRRCPDLTKARRTFPGWSAKIGLHEGAERVFQHIVDRKEAPQVI